MSETTGPRPSRQETSSGPQDASKGRQDGATSRTDGSSSRADGPSSRNDGSSSRGGGATQALPVVPGTAGQESAQGVRGAADRRPSVPRPTPSRPGEPRPASGPRGPRARRARLALRRIDPWSVFLFSFLGSIGLGIVLLVAVTALYTMLSALGVVDSINSVFSEINPGAGPDSAPGSDLLSLGRALTIAAVLAAINVVLLTALATLGALLYNVCASFTGGIELTLSEKE